jgi:hypothetical protein
MPIDPEILRMKEEHKQKLLEELSRKVPKEEKKQIIHDWGTLLPNMKRINWTQSVVRFCKFIGAMGVTIELEFLHSNRDYMFSIYVFSKLKGDYGGTLSVDSLNIPSNKHEERYLKEFEKASGKFLLPLNEAVSMTMIFDAFKQYSEKHNMDTNTPEIPALIAAWAGMDDLTKEAADWAEETLRRQVSKCTNCTIGDYTFKNYISFEDWREKFDARLADRVGLQKLFEDKIKEFKLEKVPREELILE